jgi:glycosyltransferase involved in cell wall biosynthesis
LHDADIFTLPSNYEGIPMTLIEAMGTGLPIVATAVGGVPDMLTNDENALIIDNNNEAISRAFETYYKDLELRKRHGEKAKERSSAFSATTMAKKYESIYSLKI